MSPFHVVAVACVAETEPLEGVEAKAPADNASEASETSTLRGRLCMCLLLVLGLRRRSGGHQSKARANAGAGCSARDGASARARVALEGNDAAPKARIALARPARVSTHSKSEVR